MIQLERKKCIYQAGNFYKLYTLTTTIAAAFWRMINFFHYENNILFNDAYYVGYCYSTGPGGAS